MRRPRSILFSLAFCVAALSTLSCRSPLSGLAASGPASLAVALRVPALGPAQSHGAGARVLLPTTTSVRLELHRNGALVHSVTLLPGSGGAFTHSFDDLESGLWRIVAEASDPVGAYARHDTEQRLLPGANAFTAALFPSDTIALAVGSNGPHAVMADRSAIFSFAPPYSGSWLLSAPGAPGALAWSADGLPLSGYTAGATRVRYPTTAAGAPVYFSVYADGAPASVSPRLMLSPDGARLASFAGSGMASVPGPADENYDEIIFDMVELSDGSVIAVGEYYNKVAAGKPSGFVIKYTETGAVDRSFGSYGWLSLEKYPSTKPNAVTVQTLGGVERVIVSGITIDDPGESFGYFAARVTADGRLDTSYGNSPTKDGYYTLITTISNVAFASAGKAAVDRNGRLLFPLNLNPGAMSGVVLCLLADGSDIDSGFGNFSGRLMPISNGGKTVSVAQASDGNIFIASVSYNSSTGLYSVEISKVSPDGKALPAPFGEFSMATSIFYGEETDSIRITSTVGSVLSIGGLAVASPEGTEVVYLAGNAGDKMMVTAVRAGDGSLYYGTGINGIFEDGIFSSSGADVRVTDLMVEPSGDIVVVGYLVASPFCIATRILHNGGAPLSDPAFNDQPGPPYFYRLFSSVISGSGGDYAHAALLGRNGHLWFGGSLNRIGVSTQDLLAFRHPTSPASVYGASQTPLRLAETYYYDAVVLPDGSLVAVGNRGDEGIIAKYTPAGQLDTMFGSAGFRTYSSGGISARFYAVALAPATGNLIVAGAGESGGFAMSVDPATGASRAQWGAYSELNNPGVEVYYSIAIRSDGSTLFLGNTGTPQEQLHRYTANGTPSDTLAMSDAIPSASFKRGSLAKLPDGSFAVCTMTDTGLAQLRYIDSTLTLRGSCTLSTSLEPRHTRLAIGDDGYYVVGRTAGGGAYRPYVARFSISGNTPVIDWAWHGSTMASTQSDYPYGLAAHPDGRVYLTGSELVSATPLTVSAYVIGLDAATGQPDPAFGASGRYNLVNPNGALSIPMALAVAPNGDLVVGGIVGDPVGNKRGMLTVVR